MQPGAPSRKSGWEFSSVTPSQYFKPVYRELANAHDIDLTVLFRARVGWTNITMKALGERFVGYSAPWRFTHINSEPETDPAVQSSRSSEKFVGGGSMCCSCMATIA